MNEETTQTSEAPAEAEVKEAPQPTLADVAKKYNVEEEVKNFAVQPQPTTQQPQNQQTPNYSPTPDPITDPEGWNRYYAQQSQTVNSTLREIAASVTEIKRQSEQDKLNAEVNKAVAQVNDRLKVDPVYAEILLEKKYRDDHIFKRIWDNRKANPGALKEALDVIATDASKVFQVKADPQLIENQRAAKASQRAMASSESKGSEDWSNLSDADFERRWNSAIANRQG